MRNNTVRVFAFIAAGVLAMAVAPRALAQRTTAPQQPNNARFGNPDAYARNYEDYLSGVIAKIDAGALVLNKTKFGIPKTIRLTPKTKYIRNGKRSSLKQLKTGETVYVQTKKNKKTGGLIAKKVVSGMGVTSGV